MLHGTVEPPCPIPYPTQKYQPPPAPSARVQCIFSHAPIPPLRGPLRLRICLQVSIQSERQHATEQDESVETNAQAGSVLAV